MFDRQREKLDKLQAKLATVEAKIAHLQGKRTLLSESIAAAQRRAEETNLQMEQEQRKQEKRSQQFILPKANAARIEVKETVQQIILKDLTRALGSLLCCYW